MEPQAQQTALRQMCKCIHIRCPFHMGRECDIPAVAEVDWLGANGGHLFLCQQCLDMAVQLDPVNLRDIKPMKIAAGSIVLYHGTLSKYVPTILKRGITPSEGWGGAGTEGVYLSATPEGASYWAKLSYQRSNEETLEARKFDQKFKPSERNKIITIFKVTIPSNMVGNLRADMEQAEDVGFEGDINDWKLSLQEIGDVMYDGIIPPTWVKPMNKVAFTTHPSQPGLFSDIPVYTVIRNNDTYSHNEFGPKREGYRVEDPNGELLEGLFDSPEQAKKETLKQFPSAHVQMPRTARLFKKAAVSGDDTFDRIWSDFHGKMTAPENENREFHEVLGDHDSKHQLVIALGKLNFMINEGGFESWIAEGYAATTGDLLLKKLPTHTHEYPLLSKIHAMIKQLLSEYEKFGATNFGQVENLILNGPSTRRLWEWFRKENVDEFQFRGGVTEPMNVEIISGKWGHIRLDSEDVSDDLLMEYETQLDEVEIALEEDPADEKLLKQQAELDAVIEAIFYRLKLQVRWNEFKSGDWLSEAYALISMLDEQYSKLITLNTLVKEASDLFNATPDEVKSVEHLGEIEAEESVNV